MAKNVAELVTDILHATGVKRIYGVVGDSLNGITNHCAGAATSIGCMSATRRPRHLRPAPRRR